MENLSPIAQQKVKEYITNKQMQGGGTEPYEYAALVTEALQLCKKIKAAPQSRNEIVTHIFKEVASLDTNQFNPASDINALLQTLISFKEQGRKLTSCFCGSS